VIRIRFAALAALLLHPLAAHAQDAAWEEAVRREYQAIDGAIVHIRTIADLQYSAIDAETGHTSAVKRPLSVYGSGVVIGRTFVEGRWEYLVITNHHVADVSNYVISEGALLRENKHNTRAVPSVPERSYIVREETDEVTDDDILLVEVARNPRGDMTLLRTVGAKRELTTFPGRIGYRKGEVRSGDPVITSGFPYTGGKIVAVGSVVSTDRLHELGQPHEDFTVDLPVERGQSGSPVFLVETTERDGQREVRFTLIGLLHAAEKGEKFMVPYALWKESLTGLPETLAQRLAR